MRCGSCIAWFSIACADSKNEMAIGRSSGPASTPSFIAGIDQAQIDQISVDRIVALAGLGQVLEGGTGAD